MSNDFAKQEVIAEKVANEWLDANGFLFRYRMGRFDPVGSKRLRSLLKQIKLGKGERVLSRRLVSEIWFIPQFLEWNISRIEAEHQVTAGRLKNQIWDMVYELLTFEPRE